jgi:hypothetical protein
VTVWEDIADLTSAVPQLREAALAKSDAYRDAIAAYRANAERVGIKYELRADNGLDRTFWRTVARLLAPIRPPHRVACVRRSD